MAQHDYKNIKETAEALGCKCIEGERLSAYTTFGIGGEFPLMIEASGRESLCTLIPEMKRQGLPYYIIGRGSNILAADNLPDMAFIRIGCGMGEIKREGDSIVCQAGARLSEVCRFACEEGLAGMEFACGIPGAVGGAVYMNAGAYGGEIADIIVSAEAVDEEGNVRSFTREEMELSYRHSVFSGGGYVITGAVFALSAGDKEEINAKMQDIFRKRREKQPLEMKSAGSTFKRPQGAFAAALIEKCGLKGYTIGGAQVSPKHSGFVVNTGGATFSEVIALIEHIRSTVYCKTGYLLECEPEIIR